MVFSCLASSKNETLLAMAGLVTFDFDDTLTLPIKDPEGYWVSGGSEPNFEMIERLKEWSARRHPVAIVTSRPRTSGSESRIGTFIMLHELPVDEVVYTNGEWKADFLADMGAVLHHDDRKEELERIEAKGIEVVEVPFPPGPKR